MQLAVEAGDSTFAVAKRHGISGVPVSANDLVERGASSVSDELARHGLRPAQISAFGFNTLRPDQHARQLVIDAIALGAQIGCATVVMPAGSHHENVFAGFDPRNFTEESEAEAAAQLVDIAAAAADHGVTVGLEPYIKSVASTPAACRRIAERVGNGALRFSLDVTNFYDLGALMNPQAACAAIVAEMAGLIGIVHIKEIAVTEEFHIHAGLTPLADGRTDWALVLRDAARTAPGDTWVLLEHLLTDEEADASVPIVRSAARSAGVDLT